MELTENCSNSPTIVTELLDIYLNGMKEILPQKNDHELLRFHELMKTQAIDHFQLKMAAVDLTTTTTTCPPLSSIHDLVEDCFLEIVDLNWKRCCSLCRDSLAALKNEMKENMTFLMRMKEKGNEMTKDEISEDDLKDEVMTDDSKDYWNLLREFREKYIQQISMSLYSQMPHVWMEFINERQEEDFQVTMKAKKERKEKSCHQSMAAAAAADAAVNDGEMESGAAVTDNNNKIIYQRLESEEASFQEEEEEEDVKELSAVDDDDDDDLHLEMTWGRILVFWKYWIECRKETIEVLQILSDIIENKVIPITESDSDFVSLIFQELDKDVDLKILPLRFFSVVKKDSKSFAITIEKCREFLELVTSEKCTKDFQVSIHRLFRRIVTFQPKVVRDEKSVTSVVSDDKSAKISDDDEDDVIFSADDAPTVHREVSYSFSSFDAFCSEEENELQRIVAIFSSGKEEAEAASLHLKTFLRKIAQTAKQDGIIGMIEVLQEVTGKLRQEDENLYTVLSSSIDALLTVTSNVSDSMDQLRKEIPIWSDKRDETLKTIVDIIIKLNKTTKDVAIAQTVGSSVGLVGGGIAIGGLIAAPFTLGLSLIPTIVGAVMAAAGGTTAAGAMVAEMVIDKGQMEKAAECFTQDTLLFDSIVTQLKFLNRNSALLLRYIPEDELESFISVISNPESKISSNHLSKSSFDPRIAFNISRLVAVGGKAIAIPISRLVIAGTIAASRMAMLALAHVFAAAGVVLDLANLVYNAVKLGKGAKSENAEKLEKIVLKMEEEKVLINGCLEDIDGIGTVMNS